MRGKTERKRGRKGKKGGGGKKDREREGGRKIGRGRGEER